MPRRAPRGTRTRGGAGKPGAGTIVRKAVAELDKPRVRAPNPDLPEFTVKVRRQPHYKMGPFDRKMRALKRLSDEGKLFKATNPVQRDKSITKEYKARIRQRIWDKYWPHDKDMANRLNERLKGVDPDHVWELQLGGPDTADNLRLLDRATNRDIGTDIWRQIRNLPDGTPIRIEVVD